MHLVVFIHLLFINLLFNASLISCRKLRLSYQGCEATAAIKVVLTVITLISIMEFWCLPSSATTTVSAIKICAVLVFTLAVALRWGSSVSGYKNMRYFSVYLGCCTAVGINSVCVCVCVCVLSLIHI